MLERVVARLKSKVDGRHASMTWVEEVSGNFEGDEGFREILELGKLDRDSQSNDHEA